MTEIESKECCVICRSDRHTEGHRIVAPFYPLLPWVRVRIPIVTCLTCGEEGHVYIGLETLILDVARTCFLRGRFGGAEFKYVRKVYWWRAGNLLERWRISFSLNMEPR